MLVDSCVLIAIGAIGIILNSIQISLITRRSNTKTPYEMTLLSLSIADVITASSLLFYGIYELLLSRDIVESVDALHFMYEIALDLSLVTSLLHVVFIAVQRLFAVIRPLLLHVMFTKSRCRLGLACIWLISLIYCGWSSWAKSAGSGSLIVTAYLIVSSAMLLIPSYSLICYHIYYKRKKSNNRRRQQCTVIAYPIFVTAAFIICTVPLAIAFFKLYVPCNFYQFIIPRWFLYVNSIFDPILYFLFKDCRIRKSARKLSARFTWRKSAGTHRMSMQTKRSINFSVN